MIERIESVAVVGAGYMGGGIAQSLAMTGMPVGIADVFAVSGGRETHCGVVLATTRNFEISTRG